MDDRLPIPTPRIARSSGLLLGLLSLLASASGQGATPANPDLQLDSRATKVPQSSTPGGETPIDSSATHPKTDTSAQASPTAAPHQGATLAIGTEVKVRISKPLNSGSAKNGMHVHAALDTPVKTSTGTTLPRGARVDATVVSAARAGIIQSGGLLTLQLTRVDGIAIITDVREFDGKEGHKDVADSNPGKGTEAVVAPDTVLTFRVLQTGRVPGMPPEPSTADTPKP